MTNRIPESERLSDGEQPREAPGGRAAGPLAAGVTLLLAAIAALSILCLQPGPALPADADPSRFSASRAMEHVTAIAREPRPAGSPGHVRAREHIVATLRGLGLEPEVRASQASSTRYGLPFDSASVRNVVAVVRGTSPARSVILSCHYDTVPTSPGAGDDGAGVATLLETARTVALGPPPRHDLVFLFTDAEEIGALGAEQYVAGGSFAAGTIVLNFDARGAGGPCGLIETGPASGALVRARARIDATTTASSLVPALARAHGLGTDFRPFREAGAEGLNFAFVDKVAYYHTPADNTRSLDARSLQQQGDLALGLVRALGEDPTPEAESEVVYFPLPGWGLLWFPAALALPLAIVATGAVAWLAWRRARGSRPRAVLAAVAVLLVVVVAAGLAAYATSSVARALDPTAAALRTADTYEPTPYRLAVTLAAVAAAFAVFGALRRRVTPGGWALAVGGLWVALAWACVVWAPGASYLFVVPLPGLCLALAALWRPEPPSLAVRACAVLLAAVPVVLVWSPLPYFLLVGFQLSASPVAGAVVAFAALPVCLAFDAARLFPRWVAVAAAVAAVALVAFGLYGAGFDGGRPRPVSLAYAEDGESGRAFWISERGGGDPVTAALFAREVDPAGVPAFLEDAPAIARAGEAVPLGVPEPELTLVSDATEGEQRTMRFRVRSRRGAPWLFVSLDSDARVLATSIDGVPVSGDAVTSAPPEGVRWSFRHIGLQAEGIEWEVTLAATAGPVKVVVADQSSGVPGPDGGKLRLPEGTMFSRSWVSGTTLARSSYTF
jgi:hypothetical protein